ncbi:putative lipid-transfer protein DIR1 [Lycium barbarum]|uniref:putative lipid-transfer protein DIR1 n=1 Tax=Lycium barbarum TaxID=112863 RepID=UPI00293F21C8|nr:putative lipid-transfer protein DIR1 [Lycium barbarum]
MGLSTADTKRQFLFADFAQEVQIVISNGAGTPKTICRVTINQLAQCLPAVMGQKPPPPTPACCAVLHKADLRCMCNQKSELGKFGISPKAAMKLPKQCSINVPRGC